MSKRKITFRASDPVVKEAFPVPEPAETRLPAWFKRQDKYVGGVKGFMSRGDGARLNQSARACPVIHDTMIAGYLMYLPCDVAVSLIDGEAVFDCASGAFCRVSAHHSVQLSEYQFDRNVYREHVFKFQMEWAIDTPP